MEAKDEYQSLNLAELWLGLSKIRAELSNRLLPMGTHLGIEDPKLMVKMQGLVNAIDEHFRKFRLQAVIVREVKK